MSEGNQMGYILKYGRSPAGPNSSAALKVQLREFWDTLNAEQGAEQEAVRCWHLTSMINFSLSYIRH
jgi:hypothetical protein